jgi:hypothetical protein
MKKVLLIFILNLGFLFGLRAQSEIENKIKLSFWDQPSAAFKVTQVPEKWKNESAVMLAYQRDYSCTKGRKIYEQLSLHLRIKLLDKAAVSDYSEISFDNKTVKTNMFGKASAYRIMGIKVIKTNGVEKEVDFKNAVKTDAGSSSDLKIPIPNLEPGDIIDYFIALRDEVIFLPNFGDEDMLPGKYPIVNQTYSFTLPAKHLFFFNTPYNGAPDFVKTVKEDDVVYTLKDEMREKAPHVLWDYPYLTAPHFRYRIAREKTKPDPKNDAEEVLNGFRYSYLVDIGFMIDFIKGNFKKEKDTVKVVQELYYLLRNPIYKQAYFNIKQGDPLGNGYTPDNFFRLMKLYCDKYNIPCRIVLVPSRPYGPFSTLVNLGSCDPVLEINDRPVLYLSRPYPFSLPDEIPSSFEGMRGSARGIDQALFGISTSEQNNTDTKIEASFSPDDNTRLSLKRSVIAKGHSKRYHQYLVVTNYDYMKEYDKPKYQVQSSHLLRDIINENNREKLKLEQRLTQDYAERDTRIKGELEDDMEIKVAEYKNLTLKNIGMWHTAPDVEYSDELIAENITKRAGPNIILELGKLIEKQTEIKDEQKVRTTDIYMDYARSFTHTITFTIPSGYTVEGLDNFIKKSESSEGGFVSAATNDGKTVVIKVKKYYNQNYYSVSVWPKITEFLQSAVDFYNAKLLLKKI